MVRVRPVPWASSPPSHPYKQRLQGQHTLPPAPSTTTRPPRRKEANLTRPRTASPVLWWVDIPARARVVLAAQRFIQCIFEMFDMFEVAQAAPAPVAQCDPARVLFLNCLLLSCLVLYSSYHYFYFLATERLQHWLPSVIQPRLPGGSSTGCPV